MADENPSVTRYRQYLRINTMQPNPNYDAAIEFLRKEADAIGLDFYVIETSVKDRPLARMTWKGTNPDLGSILFMSHMDVVPVFPDQWKYEPFSAHKDEKGDIYARGSQDMKCVTSWYLEAIRRLKSEGRKFSRTIHLIFSSDEEIGGAPSDAFAKTKEFKDLNAVFGFDEGLANPEEKMRVFYGERSMWWIKVISKGPPGHGSAFIENSAGKKLQYMINKFMDLRDTQEKKWKANPEKGLGAVTTVNMNIIEGGVQPNVVPDCLSAVFDVRIPPTEDLDKFKETLEGWCQQAGPDVSLEFLQSRNSPHMVKLVDTNPFWVAFQEGCKQSNIEIQTEIFPAGTDSKYYRAQGVDVIGFSPMNNTPILLHDHNEFLNEDVFLRGIDIYYNIIPAVCDVE